MPNPPEARLLLDILNDREIVLPADINWKKFLLLSEYHELIPLVFYPLQPTALPPEVAAKLKSEYDESLIRNLVFWQEFLEIASAFQKENLPLVPLKGIDSLVRFHPELHLRNMLDIDVLIKKNDLPQAEKILLGAGYGKSLWGRTEKYWRDQHCHLPFKKGSRIIEVHWDVDIQHGKNLAIPLVWKRMLSVTRENHNFTLLSPEDALLSLALHLRRFSNVLSLKQVRDAGRIINAPGNTLDWEYLLKVSTDGGFGAALYFLLSQLQLFTDTPVPSPVLDTVKIAHLRKKIIKDFLIKNTFSLAALGDTRKTYLRVHFIIYDRMIDSLRSALTLPLEAFARFYNLPSYSKKTQLLYKLRLLTIPFLQLLRLRRRKLSGY